MNIKELQEILGTTIKRDNDTKAILFLNAVSVYTTDSQFNIQLKSPTTTGKSYEAIEIKQYFPPEDILTYGYCSPQTFYHDGVWDKDLQMLVMDLSKKILIFLDQPHSQLLERMRSLLSHDEPELFIKIVDKSERKGMRTKTVKIIGYPVVIFCSSNQNQDEQEQSRTFILSPDSDRDKIKESIELRIEKDCNIKKYRQEIESNLKRKALKNRILKIKSANINDIIIEQDNVKSKFITENKIMIPRHTRDISRIISLIKSHALLNLWHRKRDGNCIYANDDDINAGFELYKKISQSQDLGLSPFVYEFYNKLLKPKGNGASISRQDILHEYMRENRRPLSENELNKQILPSLEAAGLIYFDKDPNDKRRQLIFILDIDKR